MEEACPLLRKRLNSQISNHPHAVSTQQAASLYSGNRLPHSTASPLTKCIDPVNGGFRRRTVCDEPNQKRYAPCALLSPGFYPPCRIMNPNGVLSIAQGWRTAPTLGSGPTPGFNPNGVVSCALE